MLNRSPQAEQVNDGGDLSLELESIRNLGRRRSDNLFVKLAGPTAWGKTF